MQLFVVVIKVRGDSQIAPSFGAYHVLFEQLRNLASYQQVQSHRALLVEFEVEEKRSFAQLSEGLSCKMTLRMRRGRLFFGKKFLRAHGALFSKDSTSFGVLELAFYRLQSQMDSIVRK